MMVSHARGRLVEPLVEALEPARDELAAASRPDSHCAYRDDRLRAQLALSRRFGRGAGLLQRRTEYEVRLPVSRVAAHRFSQPVRGGPGVLLAPVGVPRLKK